MSWFRWKKRGEAAPHEAAAPEAPTEQRPTRRDSAEAAAERTPARRRRGSRGGRGRTKKKPESATAVTAEKTDAPEAKPQRKPSSQRERKRPPARKPAAAPPKIVLPDVKKEIFVSIDVGEQTVAVLEDGKPAEVYLGRPERKSVAGNIYKGVVDNVLPGMEASFVDIGLERNGFLYVDEIVVPELEGKRHGKRIQELISRGEEVLVQAVKDPMGTKGARLTTEISLPGRFLVYTPYGDGIGVSRRLEDDERERLKEICKGLELPEGGLIVRTAAEGASEEELSGDLKLLLKLWSTIRGRAARTEAPALVYQEAELPLRIVRDLFIRDFKRVVVDHERTYRRIVGYLKRTSPELAARVERYNGKEPLLEKSGVARGGQLDAQPQGRSPVRRLPDLRLRRGVHRHRRQHRPVRRRTRQVVSGPARGHDHEEQPRGGHRSRAPAAAARHRRDHRHRLHRHGESEEPPARRRGAQPRARTRPDEDLRRRDLAARAGRDDASERHRRPAGDPHDRLPDLRGRRHHRLARDARGRGRTQAAPAHCGLEGRGVRRRDALRRRGDPDRPRQLAARRARAGDRPPLRVQDQEILPARPLPDRLRGQGSRRSRA